jgi:hypothetical protein
VRHLLPPIRTDIGLDDSADFYRALGGGEAGDALIGIPLEGDDHEALVRAARQVVRQHDRIVVRGGTLVVLLVGGGRDGAASMLARLGAARPAEAARARTSLISGEVDAVAALDHVTGRDAPA